MPQLEGTVESTHWFEDFLVDASGLPRGVRRGYFGPDTPPHLLLEQPLFPALSAMS